MKLKLIFVWILLLSSILKIIAADDIDIDIDVSRAIYSKKKDTFYECFDSLSLEFDSLSLEQVVKCNKQRVIQHQSDTIIACSEEVDRKLSLKEKIREPEYNFNCCLKIYYMNVNEQSRIYYGSGILIAPNLILTSGYNLYDAECGGYPDRIDCFAACFRNEVLAKATVFPKKLSSSVFIHPEYMLCEEGKQILDEKLDFKESSECYKNSKLNIGLVIFDKKTSDNFKSVNFAIPYRISEDVLKGVISKKKFTITGYPHGRQMAYSMNGKLLPPTSKKRIFYDIDTEPGQGGSGICFKNRNDPYVYCIGVHVGGVKEHKFGVLIDEVISDAIRRSVIQETEDE